jgi:hypothetical protein
METPVTAEDVASAKDVPIETAIGYLEMLERERRGLLKAGEVLRALRRATNERAEAERQCQAAEHARQIAEAALEDLKARVDARAGTAGRSQHQGRRSPAESSGRICESRTNWATIAPWLDS